MTLKRRLPTSSRDIARTEDAPSHGDDHTITFSPLGESSARLIEDVARSKFWLLQTRVALSVLLAETAIVMAYLAGTPHGMHRLAMWIVASSCLILGTVSLFVVVPIQAAKSWRESFSLGWSVAICLTIAASTALDGGLSSPLRSLLVVPVAFAGLMFRPRSVAITACAAIVAASIVSATDANVTTEWPALLIDFSVLVGISAISFASSIGRTRLQNKTDQLTDELANLAATDELTGCLSRRAFDEQCELEFARSIRYGDRLAFIMIDVDNFKRLNDTNGHSAGDLALARIGETLRRTSRESDALGRFGGDEFAILMPHTDFDGVVERARRIRRELSFGGDASLTLSYGASLLGTDISTLVSLREEADRALYEAKFAGRDRIIVRCDDHSHCAQLAIEETGP